MQHHKVAFAFAGHCPSTEAGGISFPGVAKSKKSWQAGTLVSNGEDEEEDEVEVEEEDDEDDEDVEDVEDDEDDDRGDEDVENGGIDAGKKTSSTFRNVERNFEGPTVVFTNSPVGPSLPGIRFVLVKETTILHKNYAIEDAPHSIDLSCRILP